MSAKDTKHTNFSHEVNTFITMVDQASITPDPSGAGCALLEAISKNKIDLALDLIKAKANTTWFTIADGNSVLHYAVFQNDPGLIEALISNGAYINSTNINGLTAIEIAANSKQWDCVDAFAKNKVDTNNNGHYAEALFTVVKHLVDLPGHEYEEHNNRLLATMQLLLNAGAKTDYQDGIDNNTLLQAVSSLNVEAVKLLVENNANLDIQQTAWGNTPLHFAVAQNSLDIARLLLEGGANPDIQDCSGATPLYLAAEKGYAQMVSLLLENGAKTSIANTYGVTPIRIATKQDHWDCIEVFAKHAISKDVGNYNPKLWQQPVSSLQSTDVVMEEANQNRLSH